MTEIFNRRPRARAMRPLRAMRPVRAMAALAAITTVGAVLPLLGSGVASAASTASSCLAPTGLSPNAATTSTAPEQKNIIVTWSAPSDAPVGTTYDLQFSPDQDYATNLTFSANTTSTRFVVPVLALAHGSYFWRVKVDSRACWSDDAGNAAEFTYGWRTRPLLNYPADGATIAAADLRYSWDPIAQASSYLVQVFDGSGNDEGVCVTQGTSFTPYDVPGDANLEAERTTKNSSCTLGALAAGSYTWRVLPLDDTKVLDSTKPYVGTYGEDRDPEQPAAHDGNVLKALASDIGAPSEMRTFTVGGAPVTASLMNAHASLVGPDGNYDVTCDAVSGATCASTPTLNWTAITGATSYRVTVATDPHFTNNIRVYDTYSDSVTPIDQLLDTQAGQAYYFRVCSDTDVCSAADSDSPQTGEGTPTTSVPSFRKRVLPISGLTVTPDTSLSAGNAQVTLSWLDTSVSNVLGAPTADYEVDVSDTCDYAAFTATTAPTYTTDATEVTDVFGTGTHFWRVRAVDASGSPGPWTEGNADTPLCLPGAQHFTVTAPAGPATATAATAITVETGDRTVKKSGKWVARNARGASHGSALVTDGKKKQALTYTFARSSVTIGYCTGPMDGFFSVYLDGKLVKNINSYKAFTSCGKSLTVTKLSTTRSHKLVIQASDKKGSKHGSTQLVVDFFKIV